MCHIREREINLFAYQYYNGRKFNFKIYYKFRSQKSCVLVSPYKYNVFDYSETTVVIFVKVYITRRSLHYSDTKTLVAGRYDNIRLCDNTIRAI